MNKKKSIKKSIMGITLAAIMIASIFAMVAPISGDDFETMGALELYKETYPDASAVYKVGDEIMYKLVVTCPDGAEANFTVDVYDIYPNATVELIEHDLYLDIGENKTYYRNYTVTPADGIAGEATNTLNITGEDGNGQKISGSVDETSTIIPQYPPVFEFDFAHICCCNMRFNGSASHDDGTIENHTWDFGDGNTEYDTGAPGVVEHLYTACGDYDVNLSGYDDCGLYNETIKTVHVPCPPIADADANPSWVYSGDGTVVEFDGNASTADAGLSIVSYHWKFWDGTTDTATVDKVVDGDPGDVVCAELTVNDGHCEDNDTVCVPIREKTNCTLRVYGRLDEGAGDPGVYDPVTGLHPENPPYTDPMAPFYPQAEESPRKDFITFDPIIMFHNDDDWDNDGTLDSVYANSIRANDSIEPDASEKIFKRMWYEPTEWYKDEDGDGVLDLVLIKGNDKIGWVEKYSQQMHELIADGYAILPSNSDDKLGDIYAPSIKQEFTYMMLDSSGDPQPRAVRTGSSMLIPMASWVSGNGIDSFVAFGRDGVPVGTPTRVIIESESSLGMDIDNDGVNETLDADEVQLNGNETLVLTLENRLLAVNDVGYPNTIQFFDHKIVLKQVFGEQTPKAVFRVYYQGDMSPPGRLTMEEVSIAQGETKYFFLGRVNNGATAQGPFFVSVTAADGDDKLVEVKVGRMFGQTYANIGANPYWNQKQFYVDGVCYNVVAIKAEDYEYFKYVTFRQKLPKVAVKIPNHTQHLKAWSAGVTLPEMPQYNMNHDIACDIQEDWTIPLSIGDKIGDGLEMPALEIEYLEETVEPRFHGELKEIYNETDGEHWVIEWFQTIPYEYTLFRLPPPVIDLDTGVKGGNYLLTSAFWADESLNVLWDGEPYDGEPIKAWFGKRLKFWYEDCTGPYFVDTDGSLRIYGYLDKGAGNYDVEDPRYPGLHPENPPYTDPEAPFYPQADEAPEKDFVTFNPIMMYHNDNDWNNDGTDDYIYANSIKNDYYDASEKIFKRMWYEPMEWYKDENGNGELDLALRNGSTITARALDDPYVLLDLYLSGVTIVPANSPESLYPYNPDADIYAPSIKQEFTYMMLDSSEVPQPAAAPTGGGSSMLIPMASRESGNGIDSFDADGDGVPDRVIIESEASLGMDIDNDGVDETLDADEEQLNGNETLVLTLDEKTMGIGDELQFFDHKLVLKRVSGIGATFTVWSQERIVGNYSTESTFSMNEINYFRSGQEVPQNAVFFVQLTNYDTDDDLATVKVGRMFGETYANIGVNPYWNQKHFYVDGVCYNVVAIKVDDHEYLKYVTFRQKLPKVPVKINQHTQMLKAWDKYVVLPEMPQFNMRHTIVLDVQREWTVPESIADKTGPAMEVPALEITYVSEDIEERFHGELKEIYYEYGENETWMMEWFQTIPYQYTGFMLPVVRGEIYPGEIAESRYLVTSAFYAPEACYHIWDGTGDDEGPIACGEGARLKYWFDPEDPTDIYVNRPPEEVVALNITQWYDRRSYGGNDNGIVDLPELRNAILDYIDNFGNGAYPFGTGGIFDRGDLRDMLRKFAMDGCGGC